MLANGLFTFFASLIVVMQRIIIDVLTTSDERKIENIKNILICPQGTRPQQRTQQYDYLYASIDEFTKDINNIIKPLQVEQHAESFDVIDIVDEIVANDIINEQAEPKPLLEQNTADKLTISSFALGKKGEGYIIDMINDIRPLYTVHAVANTGHLADIIVDDEERNIKYVIEVKNKQTITNADITKFDNDVKLAISNNPNWFIVGVFMSLNTNRINTIGCSFKLTHDNKIYMPAPYVNKECLDAMFTIMTSYKIIYNSLHLKATTELPENVIRLLNSLKNEYIDIDATEKKYDDIIERTSENCKTIMELKIALSIKRRFIEQINTICYNSVPLAEDRVRKLEEDKLKTYVNSFTKKTKLNKTTIMQTFPMLQNILGTMTINDIWCKYHE